MGIEENINRIAAALETIATAQTAMAEIAAWNRDRLVGMGMKGAAPTTPKAAPATPAAPAVPETPKAEQPAPAAPAEPEMTYEQLKAELVSRGIEIPKGTKMTTLQKLWAQHKADPVVPAEPEKPAEPAAPADSGLFDDPPAAPVEPAKKPMTAEQAREVLTSLCAAVPTVEERQMMVQALNKLGCAKFSEVPEGKFEELIAAFKELKGVK